MPSMAKLARDTLARKDLLKSHVQDASCIPFMRALDDNLHRLYKVHISAL
jgi:hypothetical protein